MFIKGEREQVMHPGTWVMLKGENIYSDWVTNRMEHSMRSKATQPWETATLLAWKCSGTQWFQQMPQDSSDD